MLTDPAWRPGSKLAMLSIHPSNNRASTQLSAGHLLWTLRQPKVAISNWLRLLRPDGRIIVIDAFWFAQPLPEDDFGLFQRHYNTQTRDALPAMRWDRIELVTDLLTSIGLSDVTVIDLAEVGLLAAQQANPHQWFIVTGRQGR
jgi:SAM-dependent methyltransferase